jgi:hypothetical protein
MDDLVPFVQQGFTIPIKFTRHQEEPMTGYTVHTGTSLRFSEGWDRIFQNPKTKKSGGTKRASKPTKRMTSRAAKSSSRVRSTKR